MVKGRVSVVLPSRHEEYLRPTVADVLSHATGDIEVVVILDGWWPVPPLPADPRIHILHWGVAQGLRPSLNAGMQMATGEFLFKLDAHCSVAQGFDETLKAACGESDIVVPEKYSLMPETWDRYRDPWHYFYLTWPWEVSKRPWGMHEVAYDPSYNAPRVHLREDDILTFQGSAWMLRRAYWDRLGPMDAARYYFAHEAVELGMKAWLGGGRCRIVKDTWYAHLFKGRSHKRQFLRQKTLWNDAIARSTRYWMTDQWAARVHDFAWAIEKFGPLPGWPADWPDALQRGLRDAA